MTLGNRLYEMRKAKGLSQEKLAEILGVTRQTVSKWETDQTTPDFDKIIPLCELYGISADELLKGEQKEQNSEQNSGGAYRENNAFQDNIKNDIPPAEPGPTQDSGVSFEKYRRRSALLIAVAICLYILSVIPFFLFQDSMIMMTAFFVMIAVATMLIVFSVLSKPKKNKRAPLQTKEAKLYKQITNILSGVILVIYLLISFLTGAWYITWILWVIFAIICEMIKLIFALKGCDVNDKE